MSLDDSINYDDGYPQVSIDGHRGRLESHEEAERELDKTLGGFDGLKRYEAGVRMRENHPWVYGALKCIGYF
jgi:hypothetical protein